MAISRQLVCVCVCMCVCWFACVLVMVKRHFSGDFADFLVIGRFGDFGKSSHHLCVIRIHVSVKQMFCSAYSAETE